MTSNNPAVTMQIAEGIATIVISNPERRNALTRSMWEELRRCCEDLGRRKDVRVVVIRGEGEAAFASGADISEFGDSRRSADQAAAYHGLVQDAIDAIEAIPCPVLARIHGYCVGAGTAIAAACDLRYADDRLRFGIPAAKLGIGYSPHWIRSLADVVGKPAAAEILLSARLFDAEKALRCGFANEIAAPADLEGLVAAQAETLARNAPLSLAAAKISLKQIFAFDGDRDWPSAFAAADACAESADYQRALAAFAEKRTPEFTGE